MVALNRILLQVVGFEKDLICPSLPFPPISTHVVLKSIDREIRREAARKQMDGDRVWKTPIDRRLPAWRVRVIQIDIRDGPLN